MFSGHMTAAARLNWTWLALLGLSQLADLSTTWLGTLAGLHEANPVVAATVSQQGFGLYGATKLMLVCAMGLTLRLTGGGDRNLALWAVRLLVAVFTLVAAANLAAAWGR
jgi:hypothetical protein